MSNAFETDPILIEVTRGQVVESVHRGRVAVTGPDGGLIASIGEPFAPIYPRSSLKPLQAVGMLRAGLDLDGALLALSSASHSGEPFHLDGVREVLSRSGLDETALQTPPDYPVDDQARIDWIASGRGRESVAMNCSGKHAAMLRTAVLRGEDTASTTDARGFAAELAARAARPVRLVDERLSTVSAHAVLRNAGKSQRSSRSIVDQVAAVVLLQHALDVEKSTGRPPGTPVPQESP